MVRFPLIVFVFSLCVMWLAVRVGTFVFQKRHRLDESEREDFNVIQASTLTLLALLLGFSFSMAITRYDQRKNCEETEANAIGTEYLRADFLPAADRATVRALLRSYLTQRIRFYQAPMTTDIYMTSDLREINTRTDELQDKLWSAVRASGIAQPTPVVALAAAGMNDVLNSQGYTQAAWLNRLPGMAWIMMLIIAICCNVMVGYSTRRANASQFRFLILPLIVSIGFMLISDIDSPRGGLVHVRPQNLQILAQSLQRH